MLRLTRPFGICLGLGLALGLAPALGCKTPEPGEGQTQAAAKAEPESTSTPEPAPAQQPATPSGGRAYLNIESAGVFVIDDQGMRLVHSSWI